MLPFKFAIFYFHNEVVKVESTSLIVGNIGKFNQINSRPDLTDENWLELKCPSRKEPKKTEAVKVLLFGDSFKELIQKKNKFIIGGDIWPKDDMKPREANIGQDKKKKQKSTRQEARDKTLAKLKDTLSQKRSLQASEELFSSSDDCQTPVRKKSMRIQQFSPQPSSDDTDIGSPPPLQIIENLEESLHVNPEGLMLKITLCHQWQRLSGVFVNSQRHCD
ncbi:unnamed protein product [Knipowitschia caucasica]|uniref:Uncharacterized protein n=1 Tax=Knipowitschia caucasica TaxID=637954 RepID=A0AAV2JVD0_KNICA